MPSKKIGPRQDTRNCVKGIRAFLHRGNFSFYEKSLGQPFEDFAALGHSVLRFVSSCWDTVNLEGCGGVDFDSPYARKGRAPREFDSRFQLSFESPEEG